MYRIRATSGFLMIIVAISTLILCNVVVTSPQTRAAEPNGQPERLTIVWTSGDPEVAHRMVLMYGHAAKTAEWFDEVRVIVWGPSSRLLAADKDVQGKIKEMQDGGVIVQACVVCADSYGVTEQLRSLGLEVKGMGKPLSNFVRDPEMHVLTF